MLQAGPYLQETPASLIIQHARSWHILSFLLLTHLQSADGVNLQPVPSPSSGHSLRGDWRPEHHVPWGNDQSRSDMQHVRAYSQPALGRDEHGTQEADIHKPKNLLCRVPRKGGKRISLRAEWEVLAETGGMVETFDAAVSSAVGSADRFRRMEWGRHSSSSSTRGSNSSALFLAHDVERSPFRRAPQSVGINGDALLLAHLERMTSVQFTPCPARQPAISSAETGGAMPLPLKSWSEAFGPISSALGFCRPRQPDLVCDTDSATQFFGTVTFTVPSARALCAR